MRHDKEGRLLYKRVTFLMEFPLAKGVKLMRRVFIAEKGKFFHGEGISQLLDQIAGDIEARFPLFEYRLVELEPNRFKFVFAGIKTPGNPLGQTSGPGDSQATSEPSPLEIPLLQPNYR